MTKRGDLGIILADDLTGSMDTGVQLLMGGRSVTVHLSASTIVERSTATDFIVLDTDSRSMEGREAHGRLAGIISEMGDLREEIIYKKIDSTFRGPIGWELRALVEATGKAFLISPSLPANGRVAAGGYLLVNGIPLAETSYVEDVHPVGPILPLEEMVRRQSGLPCSLIALRTVGEGVEAVKERIRDILSAGVKLMVADAATGGHLTVISEAAGAFRGELIPCGSAGLMERMAGAGEKRPSPEEPVSGPILAVAGTTNPVSRAQARRAIEAEIYSPVLMRIGGIISDDEAVREEVGLVSRRVADLIQRGNDVILTNLEDLREPEISEGCLRGRILTVFGRVCQEVFRRCAPGALIVTGGDIAREMCERLSVKFIRITGEPLPYLASGRAELPGGKSLKIVTKAGGFGDEEVFIKLHQILHSSLGEP